MLLKPFDILDNSLGINPSKLAKCSLKSLSFYLSMTSCSHLCYSIVFWNSCCSCSFWALKAISFYCHNLSIYLLCSTYFILLFCWANCSILSYLANFSSMFCLNYLSILSSSSFCLNFFSLAYLSAFCIWSFWSSLFWASYCSLRLAWASNYSL